jgi:peptidoglycan-associated lipoprotein
VIKTVKERAMGKVHAKILLTLGCVVFMAGGCAKQEMVKKDESIVPSAATSDNAPAKTEVLQAKPVKETPVTETPVKESALGEIQKNAGRIEELKSALEKIYFDFDSYKLSDEARSTLVKNADLLRKEPAGKLRIEGHCDERGSDEYNLALGEKRGRAALQYLATMGIPGERLSVISYGKEKPADPGHDDAAWAKNRRDEFVVTAK